KRRRPPGSRVRKTLLPRVIELLLTDGQKSSKRDCSRRRTLSHLGKGLVDQLIDPMPSGHNPGRLKPLGHDRANGLSRNISLL
ncbi:MAG: hypothetical protein J7M32_11425, partial [Deltaproteobacteria bacterium]|nr:hypothetical protein [Deltaproteobacteria bacterium]